MVDDGLANMGCELDIDLMMYDHPPLHIKHLVLADLFGVPTPYLILL